MQAIAMRGAAVPLVAPGGATHEHVQGVCV